MAIKRIFIVLLCTMAIFAKTARAQGQFANRDSIANAFISAVFEQKKDAGFIIDNYMYLQSTDVQFSRAKKEDFIKYAIDSLVNTHGKLLSSSPYKILDYDAFTGPKKKFINDATEGIFIVTVNNEPLFYLLFEKDRIFSFVTFSKGSLTFFAVI